MSAHAWSRSRPALLLLSVLALLSCDRAGRDEPDLVLWAWERAEDLRFLEGPSEVALHAAFLEIRGDDFEARGRRHPLRVADPPETVVVHVQIDHARPVEWTPTLRARVGAAILHYATAIPARRVQLDFEVRASERRILLDVLHDLRRALPRGTLLSMTALASWCDTETWLDGAPVDEIVPMLFRMQPGGTALRDRIVAGGDFRHPRCRTAFAVATDTPLVRAPPGRRVYLFNPRSWTAADFAEAQRLVRGWR